MNAVVIAHYKDNLEWINNIDPLIKLYIYSTSNTKYNYYAINKGHEANLYLKFIVDNYNNLPNKILFMHDHLSSWHQDYNSDFICNNINWDLDNYFSVNKRDTYQEISTTSPVHGRPYALLKLYWNSIFGESLKMTSKFCSYGCAQFVVSKQCILRYSREFYQNCLLWLNFAPDPLNIQGNNPAHLFEWTWNYIFTGKEEETKYNYNQIFN